MTEQGKPVLLTYEKAVALWNCGDGETFLSELRERGLIAPEPEPVDPRVSRIERALRNFCPNDLKCCRHTKRGGAAVFLESFGREGLTVTVGKELGQAAARPLTLDALSDALLQGYENGGTSLGRVTHHDLGLLHTALVSQMEGRDG